MIKILPVAFALFTAVLLCGCEERPVKVVNGDFENPKIAPWVSVPSENGKAELTAKDAGNTSLLLKNATVRQTLTGIYKPHRLVLKGRILTQGDAQGQVQICAAEHPYKYNDPYYGIRASEIKDQIVSLDKWSSFEISGQVVPQHSKITDIEISLSSENCDSEESAVLYDDIVLELK